MSDSDNNLIHSFRVEDAVEYGVECAVLLYNIRFWLEKNKANKKHIHDRRVWTYNTAKAFAELFPYLNEKQVYRRLGKLEDAGILLTGKYNKKGYDQTKWYSVSDSDYSISQKWELGFPEMGVAFSDSGKPIPYIKPYIKPYTNTDTLHVLDVLKQSLEESISIVVPKNEAAPDMGEGKNDVYYVKDFELDDFSLKEPMKRMTVYSWKKITKTFPDHTSLEDAEFSVWYEPLRELHEHQKVDKNKIWKVFDWAIANDFWQATIRNTQKFVEHYEQLEAQYKRQLKKSDYPLINKPNATAYE